MWIIQQAGGCKFEQGRKKTGEDVFAPFLFYSSQIESSK
jgi:hypothetical protein